MKNLLIVLIFLILGCQPIMYKGVIMEKHDDFWNYHLHSSTPMVIDTIPEGVYGIMQWNPYRVDVGGYKKDVKRLIWTWQ